MDVSPLPPLLPQNWQSCRVPPEVVANSQLQMPLTHELGWSIWRVIGQKLPLTTVFALVPTIAAVARAEASEVAWPGRAARMNRVLKLEVPVARARQVLSGT